MNDRAPSSTDRPGTLYLIQILAHAARSVLDEKLKPLGLSSFHYTALRVVWDNPGLSAAALSRRFYVTPQAMGEMLVALEGKGFLTREPNPTNQRALALHLTKEGRALVAAGNERVIELETTMFAELGAEDVLALRAMIGRSLTRLREDKPAKPAAAFRS